MAWHIVTADIGEDQHRGLFNEKEMLLNVSGKVDVADTASVTIGKTKYNILYTDDIGGRGETTDIKLEVAKSKK
tara:strand:+ start:273 stop:494 length:222 start_codon:yes stop_codon:yes gene_type:complete